MPVFKISLWLAFMPLLAAARNCTYPFATNEDVGWQPGACYRGTFNIISTCITTIVACTWSIQHLNVPARLDSTFAQTIRKVKWMVVTVLFPELVLIHAVFQFYMALTALVMMKEKGKAVEWPWWFRRPPFSWLPYNRQHLSCNDMEKQAEVHSSKKWTLTHCYFANMGGFILKRPRHVSGGKIGGEAMSYPVTANQLAGSSYTYAPILTEEIEDKSKQNWLVKSLAALQILQLILSVIARHILGAAFSQLETVTLSFASCGILIYSINCYKPQNIDWAINLDSLALKYSQERIEAAVADQSDVFQSARDDRQDITPQLQTATAAQPGLLDLEYQNDWDSLVSIILNRPSRPARKERWGLRIPNDNIPMYTKHNDIHPAIFLLALTSGLFGVMHAIAWNFEFPTAVEKLLWQIATCVSAASPVAGLFVMPLAQFSKSAGDPTEFMTDCLELLKNLNARTENVAHRRPIRSAIYRLEEGLRAIERRAEPTTYLEVFSTDREFSLLGLDRLMKGLRQDSEFVRHEGRPLLRCKKGFLRNFKRLLTVLEGKGTKSLQRAAVTDVWPRKPALPLAVNLLVFYMTSFLYCASRLVLLGIAASSLRKMPASVYMELERDWTIYLPKFSANGG